MSADLEKLRRNFEKAGFKSISDSLKPLVKEARHFKAPEHFTEKITNHFFTQITENGEEKPLSNKDLLKPIASYEQMPQEVAETLIKAKELGINSLDCYRSFVLGSYNSEMRIPEQIFYYGRSAFNIEHVSFSKDPVNVGEFFILVDNTPRQDYGNVLNKKTDKDDFLGEMLKKLKEEKKIDIQHRAASLPKVSRFGISVEDIENVVFPELRKMLGVKGEDVKIRLPNVPEYILLNKLYYPNFGKIDSLEWINHELKGDPEGDIPIPDHNFAAGNVNRSFKFIADRRDQGSDSATFRPVIEFFIPATTK
jgi:hypothetical protein